MLKYLPLPFLQDRILELQDALFFNSGKSVLRISDQVVHAMYVDELGQIWFAVPRPAQSIDQFDREFPARLDFFKKGKQFYVKIAGKAFIVNDPEELNSLSGIPEQMRQKARNKEIVLVKMKIQHADYFETMQHHPEHWFLKIKTQLDKWFFYQQHGYRSSLESKKTAFHDMISLPKIFSN
jgi:general stress protein 26